MKTWLRTLSATLVLAVIVVKAVPFHDSERARRAALAVVEGQKMPLQRAITLTEHLIPLEFQEHLKKKPRKKNLKVSRLLRKMGPDFDSNWMSIEIPSQLLSIEMSENQMEQLVQQVTSLNLEKELTAIDEGLSPNLKSNMISAFEQWLVKKSSCPITYQWEDLGEYFWPRWIKKGQCTGVTEGSSLDGDEEDEEDDEDSRPSRTHMFGCSWPKGMKCVPGEVSSIHILRWHCRRRSAKTKGSKNNLRHKCKWYKIPYPVTSSCRCACQ